MTLDPTERNPMLVPRAEGDTPACRIALTATEADALLARAGVEARRAATFDAPLVLLADDDALAERLREAGVRVPRAAGTYAERQWDARESVEVSAHRIFDHFELGTGVTDTSGLDARYAVVTVAGTANVRAALTALSEVTRAGVVLDARDTHDLRAYALATLEAGRCILVLPDRIEERALGADVEAWLRDLVADEG